MQSPYDMLSFPCGVFSRLCVYIYIYICVLGGVKVSTGKSRVWDWNMYTVHSKT